MKNFLFTLVIAFGLTQTTQAQVGCDMMNLIVNVSDTGLIKLYHPGHYLTWPRTENVIVWKIAYVNGYIVAEDTLVDSSDFMFNHNIPITDTVNVTALLTNDSAGVACLIEDQLYWEIREVIPGTFLGSWAFVHDSVGVNVSKGQPTLSIEEFAPFNASVYPNPSNDAVNISIGEGQLSKIELFSMTGRLIFEKDLNSKTYTLNIGNQPSGAYHMRVFNQNNDIVNTTILKK